MYWFYIRFFLRDNEGEEHDGDDMIYGPSYRISWFQYSSHRPGKNMFVCLFRIFSNIRL